MAMPEQKNTRTLIQSTAAKLDESCDAQALRQSRSHLVDALATHVESKLANNRLLSDLRLESVLHVLHPSLAAQTSLAGIP
jgi:hypothetical protein